MKHKTSKRRIGRLEKAKKSKIEGGDERESEKLGGT
jgi:hypothetical protein